MMKNGDEQISTTQLALDRTWLAHERTLMAWVRTSTSMISFGFTIYKFFQFDAQQRQVSHGYLTPRKFALIIISIGLVSLLFATFGHRREIKRLSAHIEVHHSSLAEVVAALVGGFGILVLIATVFHA